MVEPNDVGGRLRALPAVERVRSELADLPHRVATEAAREALTRARQGVLRGGETPSFEAIVGSARRLLEERDRSILQPVLNATGVLVHTNLGRVPLGEEQLAAVARVSSGYSNLEYDLARGQRGSRYDHAQRLLVEATGAEAALVVNNNAAALLLSLTALCAGREVVISRGELIEIGGEFRIPEVVEVSGVRLVEVGTTNRTHARDYERALTNETAAILKVHPSNYRITGFTSSVSARELARLARDRGLMFIHDVGSGLLGEVASFPQASLEPPVELSVAEGADLVTFSGDKLLGGPQAGVIVGRADHIARISKHPLLRALRVDKMTLAALEATVLAYLEGNEASLPLWRLALASSDEIERRARALAATLERSGKGKLKVEAVATESVTGGGSMPGRTLASWATALSHAEMSAADVMLRLRSGSPPVVARVEDDRVLLDLRTVFPEDDDVLSRAVREALL